jgi:hypothetical protein
MPWNELNKDVKDLYSANCEPLKEEITEHYRILTDLPAHGLTGSIL